MNTEKKAGNVLLTKDSGAEQLKAYFGKIMELHQAGEAFPVNLDDVWRLAYPRKDHAVRTLKSDFVQDVDYQFFPKNGEKDERGRPTDIYFLSTSCTEYFIAKRVKPVFEVYRRVFHKTMNQECGKKAHTAGELREDEVYVTNLDGMSIRGVMMGGEKYYHLSTIMNYLNLSLTSNLIARSGEAHFVKIPFGKQSHWYVSAAGMEGVFRNVSSLPFHKVQRIRKDLYGVKRLGSGTPKCDYCFSAIDAMRIVEEINKSPFNRRNIINLIIKGGSHGR